MRQFKETLSKLRMSLIDLANVLKQAVTEIWVMGRVARKPMVVAFRHKGVDQPVQTRSLISDFVVQSLQSISKSA